MREKQALLVIFLALLFLPLILPETLDFFLESDIIPFGGPVLHSSFERLIIRNQPLLGS